MLFAKQPDVASAAASSSKRVPDGPYIDENTIEAALARLRNAHPLAKIHSPIEVIAAYSAADKSTLLAPSGQWTIFPLCHRYEHWTLLACKGGDWYQYDSLSHDKYRVDAQSAAIQLGAPVAFPLNMAAQRENECGALMVLAAKKLLSKIFDEELPVAQEAREELKALIAGR